MNLTQTVIKKLSYFSKNSQNKLIANGISQKNLAPLLTLIVLKCCCVVVNFDLFVKMCKNCLQTYKKCTKNRNIATLEEPSIIQRGHIFWISRSCGYKNSAIINFKWSHVIVWLILYLLGRNSVTTRTLTYGIVRPLDNHFGLLLQSFDGLHGRVGHGQPIWPSDLECRC